MRSLQVFICVCFAFSIIFEGTLAWLPIEYCEVFRLQSAVCDDISCLEFRGPPCGEASKVTLRDCATTLGGIERQEFLLLPVTGTTYYKIAHKREPSVVLYERLSPNQNTLSTKKDEVGCDVNEDAQWTITEIVETECGGNFTPDGRKYTIRNRKTNNYLDVNSLNLAGAPVRTVSNEPYTSSGFWILNRA